MKAGTIVCLGAVLAVGVLGAALTYSRGAPARDCVRPYEQYLKNPKSVDILESRIEGHSVHVRFTAENALGVPIQTEMSCVMTDGKVNQALAEASAWATMMERRLGY